ncbi:MAG: anthranilate synthase component I family protein [Deltaproteobacteria bacterium]|nr:anthranilate synthase component I family protein [Deltaproteobacteria bacterium]MBW2069190.1 anthranilate synthase component I family protein [Deltaproteobacteria bacterium]
MDFFFRKPRWKILQKQKIFRYASDDDFLKFARLVAKKPFSVILLSGSDHDSALYSLACWNPYAIFRAKANCCRINMLQEARDKTLNANPLKAFGKMMESHSGDYEIETFPFLGGAVGFVAYEAKNAIERLPQTAVDDLNLPEIWAIWPQNIIIHNRKSNELWYFFLSPLDASYPALPAPLQAEADFFSVGELRSNFDKAKYTSAIEKILQYIRDGHVYQVNLSQRFSWIFTGNPFELWTKLFKKNPAPFYAFINAGDFFVLSTSMERFLYRRGDYIETRPIKGTRPRGKSAEEDENNKHELLTHPKDDAELSMIVDLLRNDLGKVCRPGSIRVAEHKRLETYQNVFHLVSIVQGILNPATTHEQILNATFPGGSITGCPKIRSMEIIDELEPTVRHVYTGAIGYWGFHNNMDTNIAIRTMIIKGNEAHLSVGGGVVFDSDPEMEYEETVHKGRTFFEILSEFGKKRSRVA